MTLRMFLNAIGEIPNISEYVSVTKLANELMFGGEVLVWHLGKQFPVIDCGLFETMSNCHDRRGMIETAVI